MPTRRKQLRYCGPCDKWVVGKECPLCGADTDAPDPEREAYERAERSDEWERRGGGGL
jgi:hypothetical protein